MEVKFFDEDTTRVDEGWVCSGVDLVVEMEAFLVFECTTEVAFLMTVFDLGLSINE